MWMKYACAQACIVVLMSVGTITTRLTAATESPPASGRPNILLIITDQQHAGMMSCAGNRWLKTPSMDALAARGMRFERAYCGNPVCVPSRFSMMTGVLPSRVGMEHNESASFPVPDEILQHAMGHVFQRAGYRAVFGGKVHLPATKQRGIAAYGFEELTGDERDGLAQSCSEFLQQNHTQPFLLVASFINPHDICYMAIDAYTRSAGRPLMYPHSLRERDCLENALRLPRDVSRDEFFLRLCPPLPTNFQIPPHEPEAVRTTDWREFRQYVQDHWSEEDWRLHRWAYARLTEQVDVQIGKVLEALRDSGQEKNTVVVFTSDHGDMDAAHRLEHKSVPYEEATRVPLIVCQPGVTAAGAVDNTHLVSTGLDLIPTLCDFARIERPSAVAGRSVRALTQVLKKRHDWRSTLVVETSRSRVLYSNRYKYVACGRGQPREMLIHLRADPGEMTNLAIVPQNAPVLSQHRRLLRQWYEASGGKLDPKYIVRNRSSQNAKEPPADFGPVSCSYTEVAGIGAEEGVCRRDPSDVIKVGDTWYVWYTKVVRTDLPDKWSSLYPSGYPGTIWCATSDDEGQTWRECGESLALGPPGAFDSFGIFTPNVLKFRGRYYLYYTAVRPTPGRDDGLFENNSTHDFTAIGLAVAERPHGPFRRVGAEPILQPASDGTSFDSYRVDDASLLVRDGKIWLYYKGRNLADGRGGPGRTQMGLAVAERPEGPYIKARGGQSLLQGSHEVLIWRQGGGVAALASISRTLQWAADGIRFQKVADLENRPNAPGAYRPELTEPTDDSGLIRWGISMRHGPHPYLVRFQLDRDVETAIGE